MDSLIDQDSPHQETARESRRRQNFFGWMLFISLALHMITSVILLSPRTTSLSTPPANFIDLRDMQFEKPARQQPALQKPELLTPPPEETAPPLDKPLTEADKLQKEVKESIAKAETDPDALREHSFGLGLTSGYFSSLAEGQSLRGDIREYYFTILRAINEKWWMNKAGKQGALRGAIINLVVARNGEILDIKLIRSSRNPAFDRAIMESIKAAGPLPPLPADFNMDFFTAPLKFVGPLNLLSAFGDGN
jgi:periplasmic protein TonB